jgi:hypothetical protein
MENIVATEKEAVDDTTPNASNTVSQDKRQPSHKEVNTTQSKVRLLPQPPPIYEGIETKVRHGLAVNTAPPKSTTTWKATTMTDEQYEPIDRRAEHAANIAATGCQNTDESNYQQLEPLNRQDLNEYASLRIQPVGDQYENMKQNRTKRDGNQQESFT